MPGEAIEGLVAAGERSIARMPIDQMVQIGDARPSCVGQGLTAGR